MKKLFQITAYGLILFFLFSTPGISQLQLQKTATSCSSAILTDENSGEWLRWDDGVNANAIGSSLWWTSAILFDTDDLAPYDGLVVTKVLVYQYDLSADAIIKIWQGPDIQNLTEYVSQSFTPQEKSWIEIELDMPYTIDASQKLVFGVEWDDLGDGYFAAGLDADSDYPGKGDLWLWGTYPGTWQYLHQGAIYGDWNKAIYVEPLETYTVTFEITDAKTGEDIDDGVVTLDDKTNEPGDYIFDNILPGTYEYMVEAEGYLTVAGEVEVVDADVTVEVEMEPEVYTVTFMVEDSETEEPVVNATVTFNGEEYMTDNNGIAVIEDIYPSVYDYTVEKGGYVSVEGEVEVVDADVTVEVEMEPEVYTVTFIVEDSETKEPIVSAVVTFDGEEYMTDNDGIAVIENVYPSVYDYTVEKEGYITVEGEVEVEEDTTVDIEMVLETFTVTLIAIPGEAGTVEGEGEYSYGEEATITAAANEGWKFESWTDEEGTELTTDSIYSFVVESDRELTANFDISNIITPKKPFYDMSLFPNPFTGIVTIKHSRLSGEAVFTIYTVKGNKVFKSKISGNSTAFDLSYLQPGVYIYSVKSTGYDIHRGYLIKN